MKDIWYVTGVKFPPGQDWHDEEVMVVVPSDTQTGGSVPSCHTDRWSVSPKQDGMEEDIWYSDPLLG